MKRLDLDLQPSMDLVLIQSAKKIPSSEMKFAWLNSIVESLVRG